MFVGYDWKTTKIYRVYDPDDQKVHRVSDTQVEDLTHHQMTNAEERATEAADPSEVRVPINFRTTEYDGEQDADMDQETMRVPSEEEAELRASGQGQCQDVSEERIPLISVLPLRKRSRIGSLGTDTPVQPPRKRGRPKGSKTGA
jgi:hypothetical protein